MTALLLMVIGAVCMMFGGLTLMLRRGVVVRFLVLGAVSTLFGATVVSSSHFLSNLSDLGQT